MAVNFLACTPHDQQMVTEIAALLEFDPKTLKVEVGESAITLDPTDALRAN